MAKRIAKRGEPIDIFADERLQTAMTAAIAPTMAPVAPAAIEPAAPSRPDEGEGGAPMASAPLTLARVPERDATAQPAPERESTPQTRVRASSQPLARPSEVDAPDAPEAPEPNVGFKFRVPQSLRSDFESFKAELSAALGGVRLDDSNLARPILERFLVEERDAILQVAKENRGRLRRPANRDAVAMAEFDDEIGRLFREASPPRRRSKRVPSGEA